MAELKCTEPGVYNDDSKKATERGDGYVVEAGKLDSLYFPGVDSCLAVAFVLKSGRMIGGHIGTSWGKDDMPDPEKNAKTIVQKMLTKVKKIESFFCVIYVGDKDWVIGTKSDFPQFQPDIPAVVPILQDLLPESAHKRVCIIKKVLPMGQSGSAFDVRIEGRFGGRKLTAKCTGCGKPLFDRSIGVMLGGTKEVKAHHHSKKF